MAVRKKKTASLVVDLKSLPLEERKKLTAEQIAVDRHRLLLKTPFIGSLLMRLEPVPVSDARLETAATDGDRIYVDIDFYASLNKDERLFVLAHETWHCALLHFARRQNRDHHWFNCAADLEIHFLLTKDGLKAPFVLPHDPKWAGLSAEQIYEKLVQHLPAQNGKESEHIKGSRSDGGFDRHFDKQERPDEDGSDNQNKGFDPDYSPGIKTGAVERCRERVTSAAQQYQRMKGDLPAGIKETIEAILEPEVNWREILAQFVTSCYGGDRQWLPPARRHVWQGLYLQSHRDKKLDHVVVAMDISGSMDWDLPLIFGELTSL